MYKKKKLWALRYSSSGSSFSHDYDTTDIEKVKEFF